MVLNHREFLDMTDPDIIAAYDDALTGWEQMMDRNGRLATGAVDSAGCLERSLEDRFGVDDETAWHISSAALTDMRELRKMIGVTNG